MTRAEELREKQLRNIKAYEARKEKQREKARKWYWDNREYALMKAAANRQRDKERHPIKVQPIKPSMESLEEQLPFRLRIMKGKLRKEFLKIPILERPTYDVFLKMKTIEYIKNTSA